VKLNDLRTWAKSRQAVLLMQSFKTGVEERLRQYNGILSSIQERFIRPEQGVIVSLIEIHTEIQRHSRPLLELSALVSKLKSDAHPSPLKFRHLELLFESACLHEAIGDEQVFHFMAKL